MSRTDNLRIKRTRPLIAPAILEEEVAVSPHARAFISDHDNTKGAVRYTCTWEARSSAR